MHGKPDYCCIWIGCKTHLPAGRFTRLEYVELQLWSYVGLYIYKRSNSNEIAQTRMQHKCLSLTSSIWIVVCRASLPHTLHNANFVTEYGTSLTLDSATSKICQSLDSSRKEWCQITVNKDNTHKFSTIDKGSSPLDFIDDTVSNKRHNNRDLIFEITMATTRHSSK